MNDQEGNPYRPPAASGSDQRGLSIVYVIACLVWCGMAVIMIVTRRNFLATFEDFGMELPALTGWLLNPAQNVFFVLVAAGVLAAGFIVKTRDGRRRIGQRALMLALLVTVVVGLGIGLPMLKLMQALS